MGGTVQGVCQMGQRRLVRCVSTAAALRSKTLSLGTWLMHIRYVSSTCAGNNPLAIQMLAGFCCLVQGFGNLTCLGVLASLVHAHQKKAIHSSAFVKCSPCSPQGNLLDVDSLGANTASPSRACWRQCQSLTSERWAVKQISEVKG